MSVPSIEALTIGYFFSACTAALTKNDMKPSFTPCSFSKRSWYFLRRSITGCMFTSLNVVRMAAFDCDCSRRSAMRARRRDMGTRCSGRPPRTWSTLTGAGGWGSGARASGALASITSALVTRPPLPVPAIAAVSTPFSSAIFLAAGIAAAGAAAGAGFAAAAGAADTPLPSVSIVAMTSPAFTVPPSPLAIFTSTPSAGAGNSSTTLSVSMSIRFSSRLTASPSFLCQASRVASETDSESCGTLTSTSMLADLSSRSLDRLHQIIGQRRERGVDQGLLLLVVQRRIPDRGGGGRRAHRVAEDLVLAHVPQDVALDPEPRALVRRLLLAPHHLFRVLVQVDLLLEQVVRERIQLGDARDRHVLHAPLLARRHQVEEHLAAAEDHALHVLRMDALVPVGVHRDELLVRELLERRHRLLVPQQALRREDDERLAVRTDHLPAQQEEHLHRGRRDADLDVVVGAQLQIALDAPGGVLGALAFVAVRQHQHHAADAAPLDLARGDELVDHHLRAIGEIAELRLPDHQLVRLRGRVAVLEAEHRLLG